MASRDLVQRNVQTTMYACVVHQYLQHMVMPDHGAALSLAGKPWCLVAAVVVHARRYQYVQAGRHTNGMEVRATPLCEQSGNLCTLNIRNDITTMHFLFLYYSFS